MKYNGLKGIKKFRLPLFRKGLASAKAFRPPGSVTTLPDDRQKKVIIDVMDYTPKRIDEYTFDNVRDCFQFRDTSSISWINITGLTDAAQITELSDYFGINMLTMEDVLNTDHRPKFDEFDNYVFMIIKMLSLSRDGAMLSEQVNIIMGKNYVITFQERPGDVFDPLRERLRSQKGKVRAMGMDYLMYSLADLIMDNYFVVLERLGEHIEQIDISLMATPSHEMLQKIYEFKMQLFYMRKMCWPLREVSGKILHSDSPLFTDATDIYFRDLYDHSIQVVDTSETLRDIILGITDLYMSSLSNRTNDVMRILTIIATLFIPLTFIVGVYGMNFEYMPELKWKYGYPGIWAVMILNTIILLTYFKRKKWF
ncbi:MAG TPA: magnesium/cobalt transporter CorA [Phycisphaerae bacterium]|nr:magnesium/cobalt transporter CorA [Phycisphaerae bacterium]